MKAEPVAIIGASSMVGHHAIAQLKRMGVPVVALSRRPHPQTAEGNITWVDLSGDWTAPFQSSGLRQWLCVCPITCVSEYFPLFERLGARRVVVLSSTSRFTKSAGAGSVDPREHALVKTLEDGEAHFKQWAESAGIEWVILRPTLIYDLARDKNITSIARFIERFGFFPLLGRAQGLRQPVFAGDVAKAAIAAVVSPAAANQDYNIAGGETLAYRDMVQRVFKQVGCKPRFVTFPLLAFRAALFFARWIPKYRYLSASMATRMNQDMVFDCSKAAHELHYAPISFLAGKSPDDAKQ